MYLLELLEYVFFRNALLAVLIVSVTSGILGTYVVTRRLVAIAGGVTHACFGGLGLGYFMGVNPLIPAGIVAVTSALGVEALGRVGRMRADSVVAVVWALGMAAGVVFVFMTPGYVPELNAFLFGNILTVGNVDLIVFAVYTAVLACYYALRYRVVTACAFDADFARVNGLPATRVNVVMTVFVALGIVLTVRLVGVMLLMSMFSLPTMIAENFTRRMKPLVWLSMAVSITGCIAGLLLGTVVDVPASALIVVVLAMGWIVARIVAWMSRRRAIRAVTPR